MSTPSLSSAVGVKKGALFPKPGAFSPRTRPIGGLSPPVGNIVPGMFDTTSGNDHSLLSNTRTCKRLRELLDNKVALWNR